MARYEYDPVGAVGVRLGMPEGEELMKVEKVKMVADLGESVYDDMEAAVVRNDLAAARRFAAAVAAGTTFDVLRDGPFTEVRGVGSTGSNHHKIRSESEAVALVSAACAVRLQLRQIRHDAIAASEVGGLEILLANVGNPDHRQDPDRPLPGVPSGEWRAVATWDEASSVVRAYIDEHDLGGGNWAGGEVRNATTGESVGRVSYNGRIWPTTPSRAVEDDEPSSGPRF
jgi:hypothetical protein